MSFEIRVDGQLFTFWETASVRRSIKNNCGSFTFSSTNRSPQEYPVKVGSVVNVVYNQKPLITGYVDAIEASGSVGQGMRVTVSGRDNLQDLVDSSVPDSVKHIDTPISLEDFCKRIIDSLGLNISVKNTLGESLIFNSEVEIDASSGTNCLEHLVSFARKKQVYLVSDGEGNLVIYRPLDRVTKDRIIQRKDGVGNNIKGFNKTLDNSQRFNVYKVRSQDNYGADGDADETAGVDRQGQSVDSQIRKGRYIELQAEETMSEDENKNRSEEINNIRRAEALTYSVEVVGATQSNGELWDFGMVSFINDEFADVKGSFMIRDVDFNADLNGGTVTTLSYTRKEAYTVRGEITEQDKRVCPIEDNYSQETPDETLQFQRDTGGVTITNDQ